MTATLEQLCGSQSCCQLLSLAPLKLLCSSKGRDLQNTAETDLSFLSTSLPEGSGFCIKKAEMPFR